MVASWRLGPEWAGRTTNLIFSARVSMSAARALAAVVTPIYLAQDGFSGLRLGLLFMVVALTSALFSSASGLLADRVGRKPFLILFPLLAALAALAYALNTSPLVLFAAAGLGSFGRGAGAGGGTVGPYQPAEQALVTEVVPVRRRNSAFGALAFGSALGALFGGLAALTVPRHGRTAQAAMLAYRPAYLITAGLSVLAALLAVWIVEPAATHRPAGQRGRLRLPHRSRPLLKRLWATNSVNGLAVGMFGPFVTYWFYRRFGASPGEIGVLYAVINAATLGSTLSAAPIARRWGLIRTVVVIRVAQGVLLVPMVLAGSFQIAGAVFLVRMLIQRAGLPLRQSYVLAMADPAERASVAALSNLPSQLAMAASPVASGYLFDEVSLTLPFEIAGALQLANAGLYWLFFHARPPAEEAVLDADD